MTFTDPSTAAHAAASPLAHTGVRAGALIAAARSLLPALEAGTAITSPMLREAMVAAFGGSDAEGHWLWKDAYDACEIAQLLFLRAFAPALRQAGVVAADPGVRIGDVRVLVRVPLLVQGAAVRLGDRADDCQS